MRSLQTILDQKQIKYDRDDLIKLITAFFPDFRNTLNKLQIACSSGALDLDTIKDLDKQKFERLLYNIKHRDFVDARKWIAENVDSIPTDLFRQLYDVGHKHLTAESAGELIILLGKYQYQAAFVVDQQINFAAFVVECMSNLVFKDND
jgi:DNA polymerase III gamma/tau subunit